MGLLEDAIRDHLDLKRRHGASDEEIAREESEALGPARPVGRPAGEPGVDVRDDRAEAVEGDGPDDDDRTRVYPAADNHDVDPVGHTFVQSGGRGDDGPYAPAPYRSDDDTGSRAGELTGDASPPSGRLRPLGAGVDEPAERAGGGRRALGEAGVPEPDLHAPDAVMDEPAPAPSARLRPAGLPDADTDIDAAPGDSPLSEPMPIPPGGVRLAPVSPPNPEPAPGPSPPSSSTTGRSRWRTLIKGSRSASTEPAPDPAPVADPVVAPSPASERPRRRLVPSEPPPARANPPTASPSAPGDPADPAGDVLEDTPDFLQETPEHERLWFEQRPPRDFDFDP